MRFVLAALAYIADPAHWSGAMGIGPLLVQHVLYSLAGVLIALALASLFPPTTALVLVQLIAMRSLLALGAVLVGACSLRSPAGCGGERAGDLCSRGREYAGRACAPGWSAWSFSWWPEPTAVFCWPEACGRALSRLVTPVPSAS